jgi:hypothetical protein
MRKSFPFLLFLICSLLCISFVQADQPVPFAPPNNVTGYYDYHQGNDYWEVNTNFPISSQEIVFPEWLFALMLIFIFTTICVALFFMSKDPAPWVNVIACGILIFGLGLSAALMAPLVGYTQVFHQVVPLVTSDGATPLNSTNTVYINEVIVYTMAPWMSYACYGLAIGVGLLFGIAGFLLQMKEARRIANQVQAEKIQAEEIDFRTREKRSR